jgi:hypothetical protein
MANFSCLVIGAAEKARGSYVYPLLLDWRDQITNTFDMRIYLPKVLHNHRFRNIRSINLTPDYLQKNGPKPLFISQTANTSVDRLTLEERREFGKQQRIARAMEYQGLLDKNNWTRSELASQLGVSRAWVTTVLKVR